MDFDSLRVYMYMEWIKDKLRLDKCASNSSRRSVKRGEVYHCFLGRGIGQEQEKTRPCVILQNNAQNRTSPNTIVAPITHTGSTINVVVPIATQTDAMGRVILDGHALLGNIITVSKGRLGGYITRLSKNDMDEIDKALMISVQVQNKIDALNRIITDKNAHINAINTDRDKIKTELDELKVERDKLKAELEKITTEQKTKM